MANIRQQIIDALATRMASITKAGGYSDTIKTVTVWNTTALDVDALPAIQIRDTSDTMPGDGIGTGRRDHELTVLLVVQFVGSASVESCRELLADMLAAIGADDSFGGLVYDCQPLNTELMADDAGQKAGFGQLTLSIRYRSQLWDM